MTDLSMQINIPLNYLKAQITSGVHDQGAIEMRALEDLGMYILRGALEPKMIEAYYDKYKSYQNSPEFDRTKFHLTEVKVGVENPLRSILKQPTLINQLKNFFQGNVGLYNFRVVKKDAEDIAPVFLHQDVGYHVGGFERYSVFIPLTKCGPENGGLRLYPGTHKFGYLGDVGEIKDFLPSDFPRLVPELMPGDILFMHSALWHSSGPNISKNERIYLDIHIQDANEPSTSEVLSGQKKSEWVLNLSHDEIFSNSRSQKLRAFYKKNQE